MNNVLRWQTRGGVGEAGRTVRRLPGDKDAATRIAETLGIDAEDALHDLCIILQSGVAILIAATQAGGAISVTAYVGDEKVRGYAASPEDLERILDAVRDEAEAFAIRSTPQGPNSRPEATSSK